jgi:hypothetical protein
VPALQTPGQLVAFMTRHLKKPLPSPAVLRPLHDRFVADVEAFAERFRIPMITLERGQRKDDIVNRWRARYRGVEGVVVIGVAQERAWSFRASKRQEAGRVSFDFSRRPVFVKHYYFYLQDRVWGPGFVKVGTYLPYPVKVCLNGHEWAKQRLRQQRLRFETLDNGFMACRDPQRLQQICDSLAPADVTSFFERWQQRLPWPLLPADREAGYAHRLALWQMEVSLTQVFEHPVQGRHFFEEVIRENLDLGRPERVSLIFSKPVTRRTPAPLFGYRTRVITAGVAPSIHVEFKRSHVKQYFKLGRALRTETTINDTRDFGATKDVKNLTFLRQVGDQANRRLLEIERVSQNCTLTQDGLDRLQHPTVENGHRASALRFGDLRVMALFQVLATLDFAPQGFRHHDLRSRVAELLGLTLERYSPGRMTYDLRRLRLKRLITRVPGTNRYLPTTYGLKVVLFVSKVYLRILRPNWPALDDVPDSLPRPLRVALAGVDRVVAQLAANARLRPAS